MENRKVTVDSDQFLASLSEVFEGVCGILRSLGYEEAANNLPHNPEAAAKKKEKAKTASKVETPAAEPKPDMPCPDPVKAKAEKPVEEGAEQAPDKKPDMPCPDPAPDPVEEKKEEEPDPAPAEEKKEETPAPFTYDQLVDLVSSKQAKRLAEGVTDINKKIKAIVVGMGYQKLPELPKNLYEEFVTKLSEL